MSQLYWLDHLTSACPIREGGVKLSDEFLEKIYPLYSTKTADESNRTAPDPETERARVGDR